MVVTAPERTQDAAVRRGGACPLCRRSSAPLERLRFAAKAHLPTEIELRFCAGCNFVFAEPLDESSYRRYYASVRNDDGHVVVSDAPDSDVALQGSNLAGVLPPGFDGSVLDFGCGQGRLLSALARRFPHARFHGHDVADFLPTAPNVTYVDADAVGATRYDVIVVTHVLEHLVEFSFLRRLEELLEPTGSIYVEVPNPHEYGVCARREFLYYFDRLHVNHFGNRAMRRLLASHGFDVVREGTHRFLYRDGHYPAAWWIARRSGDGTTTGVGDDERPLDAVCRGYRSGEARRALTVRREILDAADGTGVLVYGAGDNFRRARWPDGPLAGVPVLAVLDRDAARMSPEDGLRFETPAAGLDRFPQAPVVITVSSGGDEIASSLQRRSPGRRVLFA